MATTPAQLLDGYRPRTDTEAADLARILPLLAADDPWTRGLPLHLTVSALVVDRARRRVLLRWHERMRDWLQVGGHGDPGETDPSAVALREAREETGLPDLVFWPAEALVHVAVLPVPANDREPAHEHADLRFVLATGVPDAARPENPAARLRWLPVDEALARAGEPNLRETLARLRDLLDADAA
ncbi:NUDIX hydrolase [Kitasatospora sp. NBC_01539]|uniref:NUDIX hydrolase n=1 Tax=Kitasatospora sp. NBC_01539 TaxID=2903577 RepID=UPI0038600AF9